MASPEQHVHDPALQTGASTNEHLASDDFSHTQSAATDINEPNKSDEYGAGKSSEASAPSSPKPSSEGAREDVEKGATENVAEAEVNDPNIVDWDGPDDRANPLNWSTRLKGANVAILSILTLLTPLASSFFAPGVPNVLKDFHTESQTLAEFVVSVYILGFAVGPLVIAPMSELYGRLPIYHVCNFGFLIFTVACALAPNMGALIGFRFLQGCFGVAPVTIGGGTIADVIAADKRGGAMAIWAMGPLLGPVIGPVCGGFLAEDVGWRWIFWVLAIAMGVVGIIAVFILRETYHPVLLARKTKRLQKETGNMQLRSKLASTATPKEVFVQAIVRPAKLMFLSPICGLMSLYMAFVYGILYLLFTTFTFVFEDDYGFGENIVGLVYVGMGIGMFLGLFILGAGSDKIMQRLAAKHDGKVKPEYRLPPLIACSPFIPVGLFIYGWTAQNHVQWAVPLFGTLLVGVGLIAGFMCINTYLVDAFTRYAASALAANTVLRSIFGAVMPLFGLDLYDALGLGWGNSLLAFVALGLCAIPYLFFIYGERMRTAPRFQVKL